MKQIARRYCWWPTLDAETGKVGSRCSSCTAVAADPLREYQPWPIPKDPWERVHIDYAGPFWGQMWLVCIDPLSKFPYVSPMSKTTTRATVLALQTIFAIEGLPRTIVSDNAPQLVASSFQDFCKMNGIEHITTAPFHPASNGVAERFVRTFKDAMKKEAKTGTCKTEALKRFLVTYRTTPDLSTGMSPAEVLHGRQPRTLLALMLPSDLPKADPRSRRTLSGGKGREFVEGQIVMAKNFAAGDRWLRGTVVKRLGSMLYQVTTAKGLLRRHQNQLRHIAPNLGREEMK
ncbi:hypothetical protein M513_10092 [Trichuris suis]|uniref:Integrase catalytic domain-containing protein n=1 Tax=Trichuris suis TaxID=68888 RepID=A0A085LVP8_9BILA|nr:hypothetical protein M513_10092 [Trichuris suis]